MQTTTKVKRTPERDALYAGYVIQCLNAKVDPCPIDQWVDNAHLVANIHQKLADGSGYAEYAKSAQVRGLKPSSREAFEQFAQASVAALLAEA